MSRVVVGPVVLELDGAKVHVLEVTPHPWLDGRVHYLVSCYVEYGGYRSAVFTLDVTSNAELEVKLRSEVAKMKIMLMVGRTEPFTKT